MKRGKYKCTSYVYTHCQLSTDWKKLAFARSVLDVGRDEFGKEFDKIFMVIKSYRLMNISGLGVQENALHILSPLWNRFEVDGQQRICFLSN